jgi:hypothetical protein
VLDFEKRNFPAPAASAIALRQKKGAPEPYCILCVGTFLRVMRITDAMLHDLRGAPLLGDGELSVVDAQ